MTGMVKGDNLPKPVMAGLVPAIHDFLNLTVRGYPPQGLA